MHAVHEKTLTSSVWVLHSPYPDGSWRGIEKCMTSEEGGLMVFDSEDTARAFLVQQDLIDMVPVRCLLTTPFVRRPVSVVPRGDLDPEVA